MKHQIASISLLAGILSGQESIEAPNGGPITFPTDPYLYEGTITVNGIVAYTGSSICVEPNDHLIASILKASVTNGFGVDNYDNSDGKNTGSTFSYAGYGFTGDMQ
jgi:hypothetical protein